MKNSKTTTRNLLAFLGLLCVSIARTAHSSEPAFVTAWGSFGSGPGQFNTPVAVAVSRTGDVYVVDENNHRVQRFTNDGVYLGQWGGLGTADGQFNNPLSIAVDDAGVVYVVDHGNERIQKFSPDGTFLGKWGTSGSGPGQFSLVWSVVEHAGVIYVNDQVNKTLERFTPDGVFLGEWSNFDFDGLAIDANGFVYAVLPASTQLTVFDPSGTVVAHWAGAPGALDPVRVAADNRGHVFVDYDSQRIGAFTNAGQFLFQWGQAGSGPGQFRDPIGIGVDSNNNIFVCDTNNQRIQKFAPGATPTVPVSWGEMKARYR